MPLVAISVGSNLDREHNIERALDSLRLSFGQLRISSVYETAAVGFNGPDFYNLVVAFETDLDVRLLIDRLHDIEVEQGRIRTTQEITSRLIDLDLLRYGDGILYSEGLDIPRREILEYDFVLQLSLIHI